MAQGHREEDFFCEQRHGTEGWTRDGRGPQAEVHLSADQPRLHFRRRGLGEAEVDLWVVIAEGAQEVGECVQGRRRNGHSPTCEARQVGEFLASILYRHKEAFYMPQKRPPAGVEGDPPPPPIEKWHPQFRLEP